MLHYNTMHKQSTYEYVFNGKHFVYRLGTHLANNKVTVAVPDSKEETKPVETKVVDKKSERAKIAAELFKTL